MICKPKFFENNPEKMFFLYMMIMCSVKAMPKKE